MAKPGTRHAAIMAAEARHAANVVKRKLANKSCSVLPREAQRELVKRVIPYMDRVFAQALMVKFASDNLISIPFMRSAEASQSSTEMRMATARYLRSKGVATRIIGELLNRDYDTIRYYIHENHRLARRRRYYFNRAVHFVRFEGLHDQQFQNAVRIFGKPDFLHRHWDQRAQREIAKGDLVIFAKGSYRQPVVPFNGDDEAYQ